MTFKEVFEKYKNGTASSTERQWVEEEIEKHEIIEDYLYEDIDSRLEETANSLQEADSAASSSADTASMVKNAVRKAFFKLGAAVTAILLVLLLFLRFGLSPIMDRLYYDPGKQLKENINQMTLDMKAYNELFLPFGTDMQVNVNPQGFGNYDISLNQTVTMNGHFQNIGGKIEHGKLTLYDPSILKQPAGNLVLTPGQRKESWAGNTFDQQQRIDALNEDTAYKAYLSFQDDLTFTQIKDLEKKYDCYSLWLYVKLSDGDYPMSSPTFGMNDTLSGELLQGLDLSSYPYLHATEEDASGGVSGDLSHDEGVMTTHFISLLSYIKDQKDFCRMMSIDTESLDSAKNYVEKNGLIAYAAAGYLTGEQIKALSNDSLVRFIYTEDL